MNRRKFLSSIIVSGAVIPLTLFDNEYGGETPKPLTIPKYLKPGDVVGITCPAGYITLQEIQSAKQQMENWGFKVQIGETVGKKDFTFGGTDNERAKDL